MSPVECSGTFTQCNLKTKDCSQMYVGSKITIVPSTGEIKALQNVEAGWEEEVCVECTAGAIGLV